VKKRGEAKAQYPGTLRSKNKDNKTQGEDNKEQEQDNKTQGKRQGTVRSKSKV
jgi:hypothetical protein